MKNCSCRRAACWSCCATNSLLAEHRSLKKLFVEHKEFMLLFEQSTLLARQEPTLADGGEQQIMLGAQQYMTRHLLALRRVRIQHTYLKHADVVFPVNFITWWVPQLTLAEVAQELGATLEEVKTILTEVELLQRQHTHQQTSYKIRYNDI